MEWALLGITIAFLFFAWLVIQGTRAALAYRKAAAEGDLEVIRQILQEAIGVWRSARRPKSVAVEVWRGIQSMELLDFGPRHCRVSVAAESEYKLVDGVWRETSSPLQAAFAITARAAEMLLYELPHLRPDWAQVDVYATYRDQSGMSERRCIMSTVARRETARLVDWDGWGPAEIVDAFETRYRLGDFGQSLPVEPLEPLASAASERKGVAP